MAKILQKIEAQLLYPYAVSVVNTHSVKKKFSTLLSRPKTLKQDNYNNEPILLIALFQKGSLRPDILRLLKTAQKKGIYIIGVNTLKLKESEIGHFNCYIERPNFGRDFGSYKEGFIHLNKQKMTYNCPRLLMVNDSVFYSMKGLSKFLNEMIHTETEVLGATENFEIEYHLGSFCISLKNNIINNKILTNYWKQYKLTDVRPRVIKNGEMELSKILKKITTNPKNFKALYSTAAFHFFVKENPETIKVLYETFRTSESVSWPKFNAEQITESIKDKYLPYHETKFRDNIKVNTSEKELNNKFLTASFEELKRYLIRNLVDVTNRNDIENFLDERMIPIATDVFRCGSQIHQNSSILYHMGLPIIKMDILYRGVLNMIDIDKIQDMLPAREQKELFEVLSDRPFGLDTYIGWKRAAFNRGLI